MPIYHFSQSGIDLVEETTFGANALHERRDLQRLLREHVDVIAPGTLIILEEFADWEDSRRRIDLLGIDKKANLVVIELKRTEDGGHMELQAIRYAAMVSALTFDRVVGVYERYLGRLGKDSHDARALILEFLEWDDATSGAFATDVRIVLASAEFSKELTSSVLWLNKYRIDVRCVRMKPYRFEGKILVDIQQIIPIPEAAEYQVQLREKEQEQREARTAKADFTRYDVTLDGKMYPAEWKRNAIFLVCKHLCDEGHKPEEVSSLFEWRPSGSVWYWVLGNVGGAEFERLAAEKALSGGPSFNRTRWFCDDTELVHAGGSTYALSNQWGGPSWHRAMNALKDKYPEFNIDFSPASNSDT